MMNRILEDLETLVSANLITEDQSKAILAFESQRQRAASSQRVPLISEALGYLGAGLATAAMGVLLSDQWPELAVGVRLAIPLAGAVLLVIAGWLLRDSAEPAFARFGSVLWAMSVASTAWASSIFANDVLDISPAAQDVVIAVVVAALALLLYAMRRTVLQQIAMGAGVIALVTSVVSMRYPEIIGPEASGPNTAIGFAVWITAMVWLLLAYRKVLAPQPLAYGLGSFAALQAISAVSFAEGATGHVGMALGLLTAAGLIVASVWLHNNVLLIIGAVGGFRFLIETVDHFFRDTLGTPLVLLATGVILLVVAFLTMRLRRFTEHHPPAAPPAA